MLIELVTHEGLEDLALEEATEHGAIGVGRVDGFAGHVLVRAATLPKLRSIHAAVLPRAQGMLDELLDAASTIALPELTQAKSFAVRCERRGEHDFKSPDIERALGAALFKRYGAPADLREPEVLVRVDIADTRWRVGVQLNRAPLSHRFYPRPYQQRTSLKANVAYAALRALEQRPQRLLDPFVGSGTILLEASAVSPGCLLFGSDKKPGAVAGSSANMTHFGVDADVRESQAERLAKTFETMRFDSVVTNPPFGVRMGARLDFADFYRGLLQALQQVLNSNGVAVLLSPRKDELIDACRHTGFGVSCFATVRTRSVTPGIFRLTIR